MQRFPHSITTPASAAASTAAVAILAAVVVAAGGCGSSTAATSTTAPSTAAATASTAPAETPTKEGSTTVRIVDFKYGPPTIAVAPGDRIAFDNQDDAAHTATADDASFDSGTIRRGASRQLTFSRQGTFAYHCDFHPFMHGKVVVR